MPASLLVMPRIVVDAVEGGVQAALELLRILGLRREIHDAQDGAVLWRQHAVMAGGRVRRADLRRRFLGAPHVDRAIARALCYGANGLGGRVLGDARTSIGAIGGDDAANRWQVHSTFAPVSLMTRAHLAISPLK